jgi:EAL domain-containing protein (putative c-di-GMP-specific phosphodiesterase class I)
VADKIGFDTLEVNDSTAFEGAYADFKPDVILLDLNMPGTDGIELLRFLANQQSSAAIFVISGEDSRVVSTTTKLGREFGLNMAGEIPKPVEIIALRGALAEHYKEDRKITESDLAAAIEGEELFVCYQPKLLLQTGQVLGAEALVRWRHPEYGNVLPDEFIPLAEQSGLILPLTNKVLDLVLEESVRWKKKWQNLTFAVNLSPLLLTDISLPDRIIETLAINDFDPSRLLLEVTESGAMVDPVATMDILARLRLKGIQLSIDDFGTGFSSLVQLYRLPYSEIKIDKSFSIAMTKDDEAATIIRSTIGLGHSMGLKIVAEGIEDQETMDVLAELGCDIGQGYHIGRPVEAPEFEAWLKQRLR